MFDFVHDNKRVVQVILALIILPFAFWGVDSARNAGTDNSLATINGEKISAQEFEEARQQQARAMREMLGGQLDPAMLETPELKTALLDKLVNQHLMEIEAKRVGLRVGDEQLAQVIAGIDAFQVNGQFDKTRYEAALNSQNMPPALFEHKVRQELSSRQLAEAYTSNGFAPTTVVDRLIRLNEQQRGVSVLKLDLASALNQVQIKDAVVKEYFDQHLSEFQLPEQVKVEYVTLSAAALETRQTVSDEAIRTYFEEHAAEYGTPELRQAAHILIAAPKQANAAEKQAAQEKAEQILQQLKVAPAKFSELAAQHSQDPGSAAKGGDLGEFGRGAMVKPFEDAVFSLKVGELSGVVESDFGFHIIKLLAIKPAAGQPLAAVKNTIAQRLKAQAANDQFADLAEKFSNTVYEQSDTLKPAAALVGATVQQSNWLTKGQTPDGFWSAKLLQAVFADEAIKQARNTAAVEVAQNVLVSARVLEHQPVRARPFSEVSAQIRSKLQRQQALQLVEKQGAALLEKLQKGEKVDLNWQPSKWLSRSQPNGLNGEIVRAVFKANGAKLPVFIGQQSEQEGYTLVRIDEVKEVATIDAEKRARYLQQLQQMTGDELLRTHALDVRQNSDISVKSFESTEKK